MVDGVVIACSGCGASIPAGSETCGLCGTAQALLCPTCQSPVAATQKFCGECGGRLAPSSSPRPPRGAVLLPEEDKRLDRRIVSVLFCDLVGFTPLSERLDPEEVREVQDAYFGLMSAEIERLGGAVEKYAGDAVLAIFGAPIAHEDDAERAVRCALAMHAALVPLAEETLAAKGVQLALRIGVNSGEVVSGLREGGGRRDYAVTGDAVNTAARYQTAAQPGGVMVGEQTMRLARRGIDFGEKQMLTLKGKSEPVPAYPVVGVRERLAERWELSDHASGLIGREPELAVLHAAWEAAVAGSGHAVEIAADPGVGKSRLSAEFRAAIVTRNAARPVRARCLSYSTATSLWLVSGILRDIVGLPEQGPLGNVARHVEAAVRDLLGDAPAEEQAIARDVFGEALGLPPAGSVLSGASAEVRRHGLVQSLRALLRALSDTTPALLFLEDVHWIDQASREVLTEALADLSALRLLVLTTRRPEKPSLLDVAEHVVHLALQPLAPGDAASLAAAVLGCRLSEDLAREILERSGGNPFFVEELLRELRDTGGLEERDGVMCLVPGVRDRLPSSLHEVLLARLDRLDRASRSVAQVGSVIGRTFAVRLLAGTMDVGESALGEPLDTLHWSDIALRQPAADPAYTFKHATFQETAYQTLLKRRREALHSATGHALLRLYPADENVDTIAYHFRLTSEHAMAATWLERSADRAAAVFSNEAAVERYREARRRHGLSGAPPEDAARIGEKIGRILRVVAQYDDALAVLDEAAAAYHDAAPEGERRVVAEIGRVHRARATPNEGIARIRDLLQTHAGVAPTSGLAALHVVLARLHFTLGEYEEVAREAGAGADLAVDLGDRRVLAEAEMSRSIALYCLGQTEEALSAMEAALPVAEEVGDFEVLANLLNNLALIYREKGHIVRSREFRTRSAEVNKRRGDEASYALAIGSLGELSFVQGNWDDAEAYLEQALSIVRRLGASFFAATPRMYLAHVLAARGEFAKAGEHFDEALHIAREGDQYALVRGITDRVAEMEIVRGDARAALCRFDGSIETDHLDDGDATLTGTLPILAWAYLENGDVAEASRLAAIGTKRAIAEQAAVDLIAAERVLASAQAASGAMQDALTHFERALRLAREVGYPYAEGLILHDWGHASLISGRIDDAIPRLEEARVIFQRLGALPYLRRTDSTLALARLA